MPSKSKFLVFGHWTQVLGPRACPWRSSPCLCLVDLEQSMWAERAENRLKRSRAVSGQNLPLKIRSTIKSLKVKSSKSIFEITMKLSVCQCKFITTLCREYTRLSDKGTYFSYDALWYGYVKCRNYTGWPKKVSHYKIIKKLCQVVSKSANEIRFYRQIKEMIKHYNIIRRY